MKFGVKVENWQYRAAFRLRSMLDLEKSEEARLDLIEIYAYLLEHANERVAEHFLSAAAQAFEAVAGMPAIGTLYGSRDARLSGMRWWPVSGFRNYLVFYKVTGTTIKIIRIVHGARNLPEILEPLAQQVDLAVCGQIGTVLDRLAPSVFDLEFSDSPGRTGALAPLPSEKLMTLHRITAKASQEELRSASAEAVLIDNDAVRTVSIRRLRGEIHDS